MSEEGGKCILGHLSMLLDIKFSPCGKFIITADRDEKIRVSHYPNAYNIHNFCLGHSDFVTSIELLEDSNQLVSGSGDGTLKVWDYLKGKQICSVTCAEDAKLDSLQIDPDPEKEDVTEMKVKRTTSWPSILGVRVQDHLMAVSIEKFHGILIYDYCDNMVVYKKKILTSSPIWDHTIIPGGLLLVVQACQQHNYVQTIEVDEIDTKSCTEIAQAEDFFQGKQDYFI